MSRPHDGERCLVRVHSVDGMEVTHRDRVQALLAGAAAEHASLLSQSLA